MPLLCTDQQDYSRSRWDISISFPSRNPQIGRSTCGVRVNDKSRHQVSPRSDPLPEWIGRSTCGTRSNNVSCRQMSPRSSPWSNVPRSPRCPRRRASSLIMSVFLAFKLVFSLIDKGVDESPAGRRVGLVFQDMDCDNPLSLSRIMPVHPVLRGHLRPPVWSWMWASPACFLWLIKMSMDVRPSAGHNIGVHDSHF